MRAKEFAPRKLVIFDIDDTLVHTQTKVHVVKDGQVTKELNSHEFTHYKLQPGEQFDFENFRNAHDFFHNSKPIIPMMNQLKHDIATGNKVVMVTARADFDDRELFLDTFRKYGVNMNKVHVYRAGNMQGKMQTEEKKKIIIRKLLDQGNYTKAIMYDDAVPNLESFVELKDEYPKTKFYAWHVSLEGEASEYHRTDESLDEDQDDYEIHNYKKLDTILAKLCKMIVKGQNSNKDYGMVAACVLDPDNQIVARLNCPGDDGKRIHAERAAIEAYESKYGTVPEGSIILTTLSPCNDHMDERDGPSCTDIVNSSGVKKVYCGYMDPTQDSDTRDFNVMETSNKELRNQCKQFADTFLGHVHESLNEFSIDGDGEEDALHKYARIWYNGNLHIQHKVERVLDRMGWEIGELESDEGGAFVVRSGDENGDSYIGFSRNDLTENFADGKNPQDKGDANRHGINTKASISSLRKTAKQGGRKGQLAHWLANMKSGRSK